jgi:hypothetical protein
MTKVKTLKAIIIISVIVVALAAAHFVSAFAQPGDASDPLVTRRFVEDRIAELSAEIAALRAIINTLEPSAPGNFVGAPITATDRELLFSELIQYFENVYGEFFNAVLTQTTPPTPHVGEASVVPFTPINIAAGSMLIADAGTEFIVRSGTATVISGADGLVNVTAGRDIVNGEIIPTNNLLLVPRSDGRGFFAETNTWIMIKGGFEIVN